MTAEWLEIKDTTWNDVLEAVEHDVYHLAEWTEVEASLMGGTPRAFLYRQGEDVLFLPLVFRPIPGTGLSDARSTVGYPGPLSNISSPDTLSVALESLVKALAETDAVSAFVRLHPVIGVRAGSLGAWGKVIQHGETVAIDLRQSEQEIWRWVKRDHRQDINRARRGGMAAHIDEDWDLVDDFIEIYRATMDRVHATGRYRFPREHFLELHELLGDRVQLWVVEADGEVASAGLFTQVNGIVQFHLSGTADNHLQLSPSKLMIDQVWRSAREAGMRVFHLGGGVEARTDSLFGFKSRFSNWHLPYHTWRVIVQPERYRGLTEERSAGAEDFFPAYRRGDNIG